MRALRNPGFRAASILDGAGIAGFDIAPATTLVSLARHRAPTGERVDRRKPGSLSLRGRSRITGVGLHRPWHPPCDGPGAGPRLRVVGDPGTIGATRQWLTALSLIKHGTGRRDVR
jgi:hypothetical protein